MIVHGDALEKGSNHYIHKCKFIIWSQMVSCLLDD